MNFSAAKERLDIIDVAGRYGVELTRKGGGEWVGKCPIHEENTPSFSVNEDRQAYYCFGGCGGGDVIALVAAIERCGMGEAMGMLAEMYNLGEDVTGTTEFVQNRGIYNLMGKVAKHCNAQLCTEVSRISGEPTVASTVASYLRERKLDNLRLITTYSIGAVGDENLELDKAERGLLDESGMYRLVERGRVIIPIKDRYGKVCGFAARRLDGEKPKYQNTHGTDYFKKRELLYGFSEARREIGKQGRAFLVEGYTDVWALYLRGIETAVATMGTSFTDEQGKLLSSAAKECVIVPDSDDAGWKSVPKTMKALARSGVVPFVFQLPAGKDPMDYAMDVAGYSDMRNRGLHVDFVDYLYGKHEATVVGEADALRVTCGVIAAFNDPYLREGCVKRLASKSDIPSNVIRQMVATERVR